MPTPSCSSTTPTASPPTSTAAAWRAIPGGSSSNSESPAASGRNIAARGSRLRPDRPPPVRLLRFHRGGTRPRSSFAPVSTDLGPQLIEDNDTALAQVRVIDPKLKVLFIAGSTFPEVQFLRNTLIRDKRIQVSTWLQTATRDYRQPGDEPIRRLPTRRRRNWTSTTWCWFTIPIRSSWPGGFGDLLRDVRGQGGRGAGLHRR